MNKKALVFFSFLLITAMCFPFLVSCKNNEEATTEATESGTVTDTCSDTQATESESLTDEETETEIVSLLTGEHAEIIETSERLKNGVYAYFKGTDRSVALIGNQKMSLEYALASGKTQYVTSLVNNKGKSYLENTMDVFVTMENGKTYFASDSMSAAHMNLERIGYYLYDVNISGQNFSGLFETTGETKFKPTPSRASGATYEFRNGVLTVKNDDTAKDPYLVFGTNYRYSTDECKLLEITMKTDAYSGMLRGSVYVIAGSHQGFSEDQVVPFSIIPDGEYHTYIIPLFTVSDYNNRLTGMRFDVDRSGIGYQISDMKLLNADVEGMPTGLSLNRSFMTYSDKMYQTLQFTATEEVSGIKGVGMRTELSADTVAKLIVKDKNGHHETLDGVDWTSVEYVGFDIKGTGIFGYILPYDRKGGQIEVVLNDGKYIITQTRVPKGGTIRPSDKGTNNGNDFIMGQRIYTDSSHSFDDFLHEAYCERNPLNSSNIKIGMQSSSEVTFDGYDSLRGAYKFTFQSSSGTTYYYYNAPNEHQRVSFSVSGDEYDRQIYILSYSTGCQLRSAVLLDKDDILLPLPIEVGKNFTEDADQNLYDLDDAPYSETIFPLTVKANSGKSSYSLIHLFQRWGNYPLKGYSWIQFVRPYIYLSTGVTETNCILPWYNASGGKDLKVLPDFRAMSAPFWSTPQHNSCGTHTWLQYTDADGNYSATELIGYDVDSGGPTYADIKMDYITDDGKMKVSYTHTEMPQLDENRTYYEVKYEILEDISFKDFAHDFAFYSVSSNDSKGIYKKLGYLDQSNQYTVVDANLTAGTAKEYILGDRCPYFSFFKMDEWEKANGYSNVALLVHSSEFIIDGKETAPSFLIIDKNNTITLSLNLKEVTFKAGDSITLNLILLPWGSQESDYTGDAPDKNVRDVRENSLLNGQKATAVAGCEVLDSVFVPKIKSANGKSAEFTVTGGNDHVAIRVYGFEKHIVPKIYEKLDGKWVEYTVNSAKNPDQNNCAYSYDGYTVYYDGDGTFSYSFIVDMTASKERTFKIEVE